MENFLLIKKLMKGHGDIMKLLLKNENTGNDCIFCTVEELGNLGEDMKRECGMKDGTHILCDIDENGHIISAYLMTLTHILGIDSSNYKLSGGEIKECEIEVKF